MKSNLLFGAAVLGLSTLPVVGFAQSELVSFEDSMKCATVFTYLSDEEEDEAKADAYYDQAFAWSKIAGLRDGTTDASRAESEADAMLDQFVAKMDAMKNKKAAKSFLTSEVEACSAKQAMIASEFEARAK